MGSGLTKKAKQKVEASQYGSSPSPKLDLSSCDQHKFPNGLVKLDYVRDLNLSRNFIPVIPDSIGKMTSLTALDLSYNNLTRISGRFEALQELTSLSIAGNTGISVLPNFPRLRILDISNSGIAPFPASMTLNALTELHVNSLNLSTIPGSILSHTNLEVLTLASNDLSALPPEIRSLKALRTLDLTGNRIRHLPPEIGELSSLQTLILNGTELETFPPEFGNLVSLERLEMSRVKVIDININFSKLTKMKAIIASEGNIKTFTPESSLSVRRMVALEELNLSSNSLKAVPGGFGFLPRLTNIDLSHNAIEKVPGDFFFLNPVVQLNLDWNTLYEPFHGWYTVDGLSALLRNLAPYCTAIPENCDIEPEAPKQVALNAPVELTVQARDFKSNPRTTGKEAFKFAITGPEGVPPVNTIIRDNDGKGKSGTYSCFFKISAPGQYEARITLNGEDVKGSPWTIQVAPGDDEDYNGMDY